jgi:hypothetical protein
MPFLAHWIVIAPSEYKRSTKWEKKIIFLVAFSKWIL